MKGMRLTLLLIMLTAVYSSKAKQAINYYANKAEEALAIGSFQDALDYARQEIADYADNPNGYYQAAVSWYGLDQPGQALSMLNKAIKHAKKDKKFAAQCHLLEAFVYDELNDSIHTLAALENGMKLDPDNKAILTGHCKKILASDPQRAWKECQKLKTLDPNDPAGFTYSAFLLMNKEEYPQALEEITTAIKLDPNDSYAYMLSGAILRQLGYSPDWIRDYLHSSELEKGTDRFGLGFFMLASAASEEERSAIIEEIEKTKTRYNGYYELEANLLYIWERFFDAAQIFNEMIEMGVADATTYATLADCLEKVGFIMDAYSTLSKGLDRFPTDSSLKYGKARIGVMAGKGDDVLSILDELIAESPEIADLYNLKGMALMTKGRYAEACEPLAIAVMLNPSSILKINYGDALRMSGLRGQAEAEYKGILKMTEDAILAEGQLPQKIYALAYSSLGMKDEAMECISRLISDHPEEETTVRLRAYSRLGEKGKAIEVIKAYVAENKWNALFDLVTTDLFPLHTEQDFADLLAEQGLQTKFNPETQLLELEVPELSMSSGGTSLEEFQNAIANMTDPYETLKKAKKMCPIDLGASGQITDIDINEKNKEIIYRMTLPPNTIDIDALNANQQYKEKKLEIMALGLSEWAGTITDRGLTMTYILQVRDNPTEISFSISPKRLKELQRLALSQDEIDRLMIEFWAEEDNMPSVKGTEHVDTSVDYDGKNYSYLYPLSEDEFAQAELFLSELKKTYVGMFRDPNIRTRVSTLVRKGINLRFIFKGKESGRTAEIIYTPEEMTELLEQAR